MESAPLPKTLKYGTMASPSMANTFQSVINSTNTEYDVTSGTQTATINIPTRVGEFMDGSNSWLQFTYKITGGASTHNYFRFCSSAHSAINGLRITCGNVIEEIHDYDIFSKDIQDYTTSASKNAGYYTVTEGTNTAYSCDAGGIWLNDLTGTEDLSTGVTTEFTFLLNLNCVFSRIEQYTPLTAVYGQPIRLDLTFNNAVRAFSSNVVPGTVKVTKLQYIAQIIQLNDSALGALMEANGGAFVSSVHAYKRLNVETIAMTNGNALEKSLQLNARQSSVKGLWLHFAEASPLITNYSQASTDSGNLQSYQFQIANSLYPQTKPTSKQLMFVNACQVFGNQSSISYAPNVEYRTYHKQSNPASSGTASEYAGAFLVAVDLERYTNMSGTFYAGLNMMSVNSSVNLSFLPVRTANINVISFCMYDAILEFSNGSASISI